MMSPTLRRVATAIIEKLTCGLTHWRKREVAKVLPSTWLVRSVEFNKINMVLEINTSILRSRRYEQYRRLHTSLRSRNSFLNLHRSLGVLFHPTMLKYWSAHMCSQTISKTSPMRMTKKSELAAERFFGRSGTESCKKLIRFGPWTPRAG